MAAIVRSRRLCDWTDSFLQTVVKPQGHVAYQPLRLCALDPVISVTKKISSRIACYSRNGGAPGRAHFYVRRLGPCRLQHQRHRGAGRGPICCDVMYRAMTMSGPNMEGSGANFDASSGCDRFPTASSGTASWADTMLASVSSAAATEASLQSLAAASSESGGTSGGGGGSTGGFGGGSGPGPGAGWGEGGDGDEAPLRILLGGRVRLHLCLSL